MANVKYPNIRIASNGLVGDRTTVIGKIEKAMYLSGVSKEDIALFDSEAKTGDYDQFLRTCMNWVVIV